MNAGELVRALSPEDVEKIKDENAYKFEKRRAEARRRVEAEAMAARAPDPLAFRSAEEVMEEPPIASIIDGFAWAGRTSVLVSESGRGKTFVILDAAAAVAEGRAWHGRRTRLGSVAFISFEGDALNLRLRGLQEIGGRSLDNLYVLRASEPISPAGARDGESASMGEVRLAEALANLREGLAAEGKPPVVLVFIDTVRASLVGSEDSSEAVSAYLRAAKRAAAATPEAGLVLVHHAGWQDGEAKRKRERGSSAFRGNVDGTFYLDRTGDLKDGLVYLEFSALKVRDGGLWTLPLRLRVVELGLPIEGEAITTCVVEDVDPAEIADAKREARTAAEEGADRAVLRAMLDSEPTNLRELRREAGLKQETVNGAVDRLIRRRFAAEGKRGQPYVVTPAGREWLFDEGDSL